MNFDFSFLPLAEQAAENGQGSPWMMMIPLLLLIGFMFIMSGRQNKQQKQHQKMINELKSGDDVLTEGGIFGTITNVKDDRFIIRTADNTKFEIAKAFVKIKVNKDEDSEKKA